jgi:hypothetical protein
MNILDILGKLFKEQSLSQAYEGGIQPRENSPELLNSLLGVKPGGFQSGLGALQYLVEDNRLQGPGFRYLEEPISTGYGVADTDSLLDMYANFARMGEPHRYPRIVPEEVDNWEDQKRFWPYWNTELGVGVGQ